MGATKPVFKAYSPQSLYLLKPSTEPTLVRIQILRLHIRVYGLGGAQEFEWLATACTRVHMTCGGTRNPQAAVCTINSPETLRHPTCTCTATYLRHIHTLAQKPPQAHPKPSKHFMPLRHEGWREGSPLPGPYPCSRPQPFTSSWSLLISAASPWKT